MRVNLKGRQAAMRRAYLHLSTKTVLARDRDENMSLPRYWSLRQLLNLLTKVLCNP